jgi:hypothetical protein
MAIGYIATVILPHVGETLQFAKFVVVGHKFDWKPRVGVAFVHPPRTLERSQQRLFFGRADHDGDYSLNSW